MTLNTASGQPSDNRNNDFAGASVPSRIGYRFQDLDPGANIYVQRDDKLVIQMVSNSASEVINVNARLLIPGREAGRTQPDASTVDNKLGDSPVGSIIAINSMVKAANVSTIGTKVLDLAEGYLLSITLSSTIVTVRGRTYARAYILRGSNSVVNVSYLLCGDYITINTPTGFPFSAYQPPVAGQGWRHTQQLGTIAAGTDPSIANSNLSRSNVIAFMGRFTASAAVANRVPSFVVLDNISAFPAGVYSVNAPITAGQVIDVVAAPGILPAAVLPNTVYIVLPQLAMLSNSGNIADGNLQPGVTTTNIQAGDQWSRVTVVTEEWIDF